MKIMTRFSITVLAVVLGANAACGRGDFEWLCQKRHDRQACRGRPGISPVPRPAAPKEVGRGKTDASGRFRFTVAGTPGGLCWCEWFTRALIMARWRRPAATR